MATAAGRTTRTLDKIETNGVEPVAQVYRFNDAVAVYLENGDTVYLTPDNALTIAEAMGNAARDIMSRPFTSSDMAVLRLDCEDAKAHKLERSRFNGQ